MGGYLTKEGLQKATDRLGGLYSCKYTKPELDVWWFELEKQSMVDDSILMETIELLRRGEKGSWKPNLNTFLFYLNDVRINRREQQWDKQKQEENKYRNLGYNEILEKGEQHNSPKVRAWIALTKQLLSGEIDKQEFDEKHKRIGG